jgi:hypothetical protein
MAIGGQKRAGAVGIKVQQLMDEDGQALGGITLEEEARTQPKLNTPTSTADDDAGGAAPEAADAGDGVPVGADGDDHDVVGDEPTQRWEGVDGGGDDALDGGGDVWAEVRWWVGSLRTAPGRSHAW